MADVYGALAEDRPYQSGLETEQILAIMSKEVPHKLDPDCFQALLQMLSGRTKPAAKQILRPALPLCAQTIGGSAPIFVN